MRTNFIKSNKCRDAERVENRCGVPRATLQNHIKYEKRKRSIQLEPNSLRKSKRRNYFRRKNEKKEIIEFFDTDYFQKWNKILEQHNLNHFPSKLYKMDERG